MELPESKRRRWRVEVAAAEDDDDDDVRLKLAQEIIYCRILCGNKGSEETVVPVTSYLEKTAFGNTFRRDFVCCNQNSWKFC